ncbi:hypothetical protein B0H11DRAFT_1161482 [Mycena galericulata]|nr:hypothetical protein B0H11DRAFT_1161482 [Mycena galericulata]
MRAQGERVGRWSWGIYLIRFRDALLEWDWTWRTRRGARNTPDRPYIPKGGIDFARHRILSSASPPRCASAEKKARAPREHAHALRLPPSPGDEIERRRSIDPNRNRRSCSNLSHPSWSRRMGFSAEGGSEGGGTSTGRLRGSPRRRRLQTDSLGIETWAYDARGTRAALSPLRSSVCTPLRYALISIFVSIPSLAITPRLPLPSPAVPSARTPSRPFPHSGSVRGVLLSPLCRRCGLCV